MAVDGPRLTQRILAWTGMALLAVVLVLISTPPRGADRIVDLEGAWTVEQVTPDPGDLDTLSLPGLFERQGIDPHARVRVSRTVDLPDDGARHAVWLENPQYAIRMLWNDFELDGSTTLDATNWDRPSDASILAPLPLGSGAHRLTLEIQGSFDEGGLTGRMLVGPTHVIVAVARQMEAQKLGLSLLLAILGMVQLAIASRPTLRPAHLFFGLFACILAVWTFCHSDTSMAILDDLLLRLRVRRLCIGLAGPLGVAFAASFLRGAPRRGEWAFLGVGAILGLSGIVLPADWLYSLEKIEDVVVLFAIGWFGVLASNGLRDRVPGAGLLLLAALPPLLFGVLGEMAISHGLASGTSVLFAAFTLFAAGATGSLALRHADESDRHERLVAGSSDGIVTVDRTGVLADTNPAARLLFGTEARGHNLLEWVAVDDRPLVRAHIARGTDQPDRSEFRLCAGTREQVVESMATPLEKGTALLVLRDVTGRRKLDQGMLHAARMETVGVLVGGIAHDFNNMLGTLLAHVGFLQATLQDGPPKKRLLRMESTIERASLLTRRLLTVAGGTSSDLDPVQLGPICRSACELVEPMLPPGVDLSLRVEEGLPPVLGSATDLEQVLVNLLVNARDAVAGNGRIEMRVRSFQLESGARGVVVNVEDDGPGVPDALKEEIFTPFVTTKGPQKGSGLGLAVSAQILRDHHGRIWVEDRPGGGARFLIALRHADTVDEAPAPLPENLRVVLVEDEEVLLETYAAALAEAGYEVIACSRGADALEALQEREPGLLVTDVVMPGLSGIELATIAREMYPQMPILLVSGFIPKDDSVRDPSWHRLDKPLRAARLVATAGRLCRRAERAARGDLDITEVTYLFPPLDELRGDVVDPS